MSSTESGKPPAPKKRATKKKRATVAEEPGLTSDFGTNMVNVYVGPKRKKWTLHKTLLCNRAPFFHGALEGRFRESEEQEVHLAEDDPEGFDLFVYWLYHEYLPSTNQEMLDSADLTSSRISALCMFYVQADKFLLPTTIKTDALDKVLHMRSKGPASRLATSVDLVTYIQQNTADDDPLRTLVLDFACADYLANDQFIAQIDKAAESETPTFDAPAFLNAFRERYQFNVENNTKTTRGRSIKPFFDPAVFYTRKHSMQPVACIARYQTGYLARPKPDTPGDAGFELFEDEEANSMYGD